ncbi:rolling circle replication-associated protein [Herbaspirillum huttiense]|uniref:rolling circle replication-associated protein n=1 Tax=Herbaspirillum huttiense TaxID=863372 RepID=UPI0031DA25D3
MKSGFDRRKNARINAPTLPGSHNQSSGEIVLTTSIDKAAANAKLKASLGSYFAGTDAIRWKTLTVTEFPKGVEVLLDESYETHSDGQMFDYATEVEEPTKRGEGDHEKARIAAARRAKTKVRRLAKMLEADCLLTLTYRECMTDYARVEADFKAFRERLRSLGEFHYVATLEVQRRGALHVHIACQQFPAWLQNEHGVRVRSWNLIRSMWRRVVGKDNGNVDFTRPRGRNSAHRIASYISKYVSKNLEEARFNKKSYWASRGIPKPNQYRIYFNPETSSFDIVVLVAQEFSMRGFDDITQYHDRLNSFYWFAAGKS